MVIGIIGAGASGMAAALAAAENPHALNLSLLTRLLWLTSGQAGVVLVVQRCLQ